MTHTITTAALATAPTNCRVLVEVGQFVDGVQYVSPARRKTGNVVVARVLKVEAVMVNALGSSGRRTRVYRVTTTAGVTERTRPAETFWLAPEDPAAVQRARAEASAENERRAAVQASPPPVPAAAPAERDDLDAMKFPALLELARLHDVPGRGTARIGQLREGIRAARAAADGALRTALLPRVPALPAAQPAALPAGKAAGLLRWRQHPTVTPGTTLYRSACGRYEIRGEDTAQHGWGRPDARTFTVYSAPSGRQLTPRMRRLIDAKTQAQTQVEDRERAHNSARLMEAARLAGDPRWADAECGQRILALAEDVHRQHVARKAAAASGLSGLGRLAQAHRAAM